MRLRGKEIFSYTVIIIAILIILGAGGYFGYNYSQDYVEGKQVEVIQELVRGIEENEVSSFQMNDKNYVCIEYNEKGG